MESILQEGEDTVAVRIYHIVLEKDYAPFLKKASYTPANFREWGFVHCSLKASVLPVANDYYWDVRDRLLVLKIDPTKLLSRTKFESAAPERGAKRGHRGSSPLFPHVYGSINTAAVEGIAVLKKGKHGFLWPRKFVSPADFVIREDPEHQASGCG